MSKTLCSLAALAMLALISAGCSNAPTGAAVGSSGTNSAAAQNAAPAGASAVSSGGDTANHEQALQFARCMRANGVSEFPDPDASGAITIDQVANGSSVDPNSAAFKQAISACKDLEPAGFTGGRRSPEQQQAALKYAQCIRDNGVKDF